MALEQIGATLTLKDRRQFSADAERARRDVKNIGDAADKSGRKAARAARGFDTMGGSLGGVATLARRAATGLTLVGAAGAAAIFKIGSSYEESLNIFQSVTKANVGQMRAVGEQAKILGSDMTLPAVSAADAAVAMTELAKGGLSVESAMGAALGTLQLAGAAGVDAATAAAIQASALNQFRLGADKAGLVADILANTANAASGEVTDMALALSYTGPVAAALGISIADTATSIGLLAKNGILGEKAGTALRATWASLADPSEKAAKGLATLGINAFNAKGEFVGLRRISDDLAKAQKRLTKEQFAQAAAAAFGREPLAAVAALAAEGALAFDAMGAAVIRQGGAADVSAARSKGLKGALGGLTSQLETLAIEGYEKVKGPAERFVRTLADKLPGAAKKAGDIFRNDVLPVLTTMVATFKSDVLPVLTDLVTVIRRDVLPVAKDVALVVGGAIVVAFKAAAGVLSFLSDNGRILQPILAALVSGFVAFRVVASVTKAWAALNTVMALNPIGLVVIAVAALAGALAYAWKNSETFRDVATSAFGLVQGVVREVVDKILMFLGWIVGAAAKAFGWVPGIGEGLRTAAKDFEQFRDNVNAALGGIADKDVTIQFRAKYAGPPVPLGSVEGRPVLGPAVPVSRSTPLGPPAPGLASGGVVRRGGMALFGERGPELGFLPAGLTMLPAAQTNALPERFARLTMERAEPDARLSSEFDGPPTAPAGDLVIPITVELDGRVLWENTKRYARSDVARS